MKTRIIRKIVKIDEEKCNGCGACAIACAEGALKIIDGKARLISEQYCDGLGACLRECPQGAITVEERESEEFDEAATKNHLAIKTPQKPLPCGCPSSNVARFESTNEGVSRISTPLMLTNWPVQLALVPPEAPFLKNADLLLTAHCAPFAHAGFHDDYLKGRRLIIACPKLDDFNAHQQKLTAILGKNNIKSLTVVHMEVPCCSGLVAMARRAIAASGKNVPLKEITISIRGQQLSG